MTADKLLDIRDITANGVGGKPTVEPVMDTLQSVSFTIHFSLSLENGEIIDSTANREPVTFTTGDGNLLPGFEHVMLDQQPGEKMTYHLQPEEAFGVRLEENIHTVPLYQFPADLALEEGLVVGFSDQNGNEQPGVITRIGRTSAEIDFNHPLAGKTIVFTVEVLDRSVQSEAKS